MSSSVGMMTFPIYGKESKCSKPPTRVKKKSDEVLRKKKGKSDESDEVLSLYLYDDIYIIM